MTNNYARQSVMDILDNMTIADKIYQGVIDITEHINFQEIAGQFNLTAKEYESLINDTQEIVDSAVKNYFKEVEANE